MGDGLQCTATCRLVGHADQVLACAAQGNLRLLQHCTQLCGNAFGVRDAAGRTALHATASLGHHQLVQWLCERKRNNGCLDAGDTESNWTPLHRAVYYGHLGVATSLVKVSCSGASDTHAQAL